MPLSRFVSVALFLGLSFSANSHTIHRNDKWTSLIFSGSELKHPYRPEQEGGRILSDDGFRLGCVRQTPFFHSLPMDMTLTSTVAFTGKWNSVIEDVAENVTIELARISVSYLDQIGTKQREWKFIFAQDFGPVRWFFQSSEGTHFYGKSEQTIRSTIGPIVIPAMSRNIAISVCYIAPRTEINIESIEVQFFPN